MKKFILGLIGFYNLSAMAYPLCTDVRARCHITEEENAKVLVFNYGKEGCNIRGNVTIRFINSHGSLVGERVQWVQATLNANSGYSVEVGGLGSPEFCDADYSTAP